MPRPESITAEDVASWDATAAEYNDDWQSILAVPFMRELAYAGYWIGDQLAALGTDQPTIDATCFAFGQRAFGRPDPWEVATTVLANFLAGQRDKPGPELADKLIDEMLGG